MKHLFVFHQSPLKYIYFVFLALVPHLALAQYSDHATPINLDANRASANSGFNQASSFEGFLEHANTPGNEFPQVDLSDSTPWNDTSNQATDPENQRRAVQAIQEVIERLGFGAPFHAKVRERVWTSGQDDVVGVGTYEQAGHQTGRFNLHIFMHDGEDEGKHELQQISDGRLAWTRTKISGNVQLKRVDVRKLEQRIAEERVQVDYPTGLLIGGLTELLDTVRQDYSLRLDFGKLPDDPRNFLVISGKLHPSARQRILEQSGRQDWPSLCPTGVRILIATEPDPATRPETTLGAGLPSRISFFSDPPTADQNAASDDDQNTNVKLQTNRQGRRISMLELYSIQPIFPPPPVERFRFESRDEDNNGYVNETQRYLSRYGL